MEDTVNWLSSSRSNSSFCHSEEKCECEIAHYCVLRVFILRLAIVGAKSSVGPSVGSALAKNPANQESQPSPKSYVCQKMCWQSRENWEWRRNLEHTPFFAMNKIIAGYMRYAWEDGKNWQFYKYNVSAIHSLRSHGYCYCSPALNTVLPLVRRCHVTQILSPDWPRLSPDLTRTLCWPQAGAWVRADPWLVTIHSQRAFSSLAGHTHTENTPTPPPGQYHVVTTLRCHQWDQWHQCEDEEYGIMWSVCPLVPHCYMSAPGGHWPGAQCLVSGPWRHPPPHLRGHDWSQNNVTTPSHERPGVDSLVMVLRTELWSIIAGLWINWTTGQLASWAAANVG